MAHKEELHPAIGDREAYKGSGKEMGLVHAPIVSVNPVSADTNNKSKEKADIKVFDVNQELFDSKTDKTEDGMFPFSSLKPGQAFFIPTKEGQTTDKLMENMYSTIHHVRESFAEVQRNENGDKILENVTIETRKKNDDGTLQLQNGEPIVGANFTHMPKYIYTRNFIAKAVVKDNHLGDNFKAPSDGVVVIRVL